MIVRGFGRKKLIMKKLVQDMGAIVIVVEIKVAVIVHPLMSPVVRIVGLKREPRSVLIKRQRKIAGRNTWHFASLMELKLVLS